MGLLYPTATRQRIAAFFLVLMVTDLGFPVASYALTSGPSQPEFSSFEPVSTNQLVDEFSGDFTYNIPVINIPGPQGSDYPLSLSYHSGATPEEEASWVGYGWTLNPGAINRNTRGFPDDYNNAPVVYHNKMPANWTVTVGGSLGVEVFGKDGPNASLALRYNNYQGYGYNAGVGISLGKGVVSLGYNVVDGNGSFSGSVNPAALINKGLENKEAADAKDKSTHGNKTNDEKKPTRFAGNRVSLMGGNHGLFTYSEASRPSRATNYYGASVNVSAGLEINPLPIPLGQTTNVFGSFAWQKNVEQDQLPAYGYMYGAAAGQNKDAIQDYFTEKETPYNKRDNFLGIPFNNADVFSVSGEGVGGGFRLYHHEVGEFAPNFKTSKIAIANIGAEASVGTNIGAGLDVGAGWQSMSEGPWEEANRPKFSAPNLGDDGVFFRFANDLGGQSAALGALPDEPVKAELDARNPAKLTKMSLAGQRDKMAAHGRASHIAYHTVADVYQSGTRRFSRSFSQRSDLPVNHAALRPDAICEMAVTTAAGGRYIYGLPVLSREEGNLQYSIKGSIMGETLSNNYTVATETHDEDLDVKVGETRSTAYASSFPVTEIRTPDYIDRQLDGPTPDDFGGYTRFNYRKAHGGNSLPWYNWRIPYNGLLYQVNSLSDKADDMGTVSYGQKEIVYLQSVQTKTHTAIFRTAPREDGRDAGVESSGSGTPRARTGVEDPAGNRALKLLEKLVQIDLYVNADVEKDGDTGLLKAKSGAYPIKSVHFSYTHELAQAGSPFSVGDPATYGLPNASLDASRIRRGKLTLAKIWFEYKGVPTKISPYTFSYAYPNRESYAQYPAAYRPGGDRSVTTATPDELPTGATDPGYYDQLSAAAQNPVYDPFSLDAWGNYRREGPKRAGNLQAWLDQRDRADYPLAEQQDWDPAAWQLKGITLPTGGQIQVQYEPDDYAFVQNKPVHAMASLSGAAGGVTGNKYYINLASLGLTTPAEREATRAALAEQYLAGGNRKIFFKFLYSLTGAATPTLQPLTRNSEYISGYASVEAVGLEDERLFIQLKSGTSANYTLPHQVCKNFLQTQRAGKLDGNGFLTDKQADKIKGDQAVRELLAWFKTVARLGPQCAAVNWELSYFRIPLVKAKKGGGLRVKRLLTFDKTGLDGQSVLYGSEYLYRLRDAQGKVISSGVATTEPAAMREENILVDYLPRQGQSLGSKIISGIDRKQTEGPLGESLLPAPSVGYSRVVTRNIHSGRTSTGYTVSEFATARDYPMQVKYTTLQSKTVFKLQYAFLLTNQVNNTYATQGYSFILNNMHGQVRRRATYPGTYPGNNATQFPSPTNEQKYTYYEPAKANGQQAITPGDFIPVATEHGEKISITPVATRIYPGREVDITTAQKAVKDNMVDLNYEKDASVGIFPLWFVPYATIIPFLIKSQAELYTHVTSKVVRYPAVIKRIETTQDGIRHTTENIAFDRFSGQVVQTRATDEFQGGYVQETVQAAWVRPELGPKWEHENLIIRPTEANTPTGENKMQLIRGTNNEVWLQFRGNSRFCAGLSKITRGDHLALTLDNNNGDNVLYFADAPDFLADRVRLYPVALPLTSALPSIINEKVTALQIVTSGRSNQLTAAAGSTTYHGPDYTKLHEVGPFTTALKYGDSDFASAINGWLRSSTKVADKLQVSGTTYRSMNMSAFAHKLPAGCVQDPSNVDISDVVVAKQQIDGKIKIAIVSFKVTCDSGGPAILVEN